MSHKLFCALLAIFLFVCNASPAFAVGSTGFENAEFSSYSLSQSNAVTAQPYEPAAISYNPAGIAELKGVQAQSNMTFNSIMTRIKDSRGGSTESSDTLIGVPTGYVTINPGPMLNDRLTFGIGSDAPFGLMNKYDSNHQAVRYTGFKNWMKMFTLKPTVGIKITDWFSFAAGAMNYRMMDYGGLMAYPNTLLVSGAPDGQLRANLSGQSWGWHLGALLKPHPRYNLGFYFRSPVNMRLRGRVKVENASPLVGQRHFETGAYADLDLPMNMTLGQAFKVTEKTTVALDLGYTRWSTLDRVDIHTDPVDANNDVVLRAMGIGSSDNKDYKDAFSIHLGGNRQMTKKLNLRLGSLFYTAAVPKTTLIPAVPDSNRLAFSIGLGYDINSYLKAELCYFHMLGLRRSIDNGVSESLGTTVDGRYFSNYKIFSFTFTLMWEEIFNRTKTQSADAKIAKAPEPILTA